MPYARLAVDKAGLPIGEPAFLKTFPPMDYSELSERNYKRISLINWSLTLPMLILFAWPYYLVATWTGVSPSIANLGAVIFAIPFMMTVLHGHVTMALGALHRHHYYKWLLQYPLSFGFFFHPVMFRTRFRISIAVLALFIMMLSWLFNW